MNIAIVTHNVIRGDGQGRVNYEIALHARQHGIGVCLLADRVDQDLLDRGALWIPIHPRHKRPVLLKVLEFERAANRVLRDRHAQFDVVHGNGFVLSSCHHVNTAHLVHGAWKRSPVRTGHARYDMHAVYQRAYTNLNAMWEKKAFRMSRTVVAVSGKVRQELTEIGVPSEHIRVVPNGVDLDEFHPAPADRGLLGLPEGAALALFVGGIRTPLKNLDTVLEAMKFLPSVHLAVVGDSSGSTYPETCSRLGLLDRVHFLGFRADVNDIMRASDIFVFPSLYESFSLVVLEALASGLPVITARTVGASELVTEDCGRVLSDPNDVNALVYTIEEMLGNPRRLEKMRHAARKVAEGHSWDKMAMQYVRLYEEVAG